MDPITVVGAVASVLQLAQSAITLSTTIYSVGSAIKSASADLKALAEDLETFSQSLKLLHRLLDDHKNWYSDDVYLLTAKIIRDCADLYAKIDKVLAKFSKKSFMNKVKFVVKTGEVKKLLDRLRDMKGTLATILMSLQLDLQLSLLISSPSKIQRPAATKLKQETLLALQAAEKHVTTTSVVVQNIYVSQVRPRSPQILGNLPTSESLFINTNAISMPQDNVRILPRAIDLPASESASANVKFVSEPSSQFALSQRSRNIEAIDPVSESGYNIQSNCMVSTNQIMNVASFQINSAMPQLGQPRPFVQNLAMIPDHSRGLESSSSMESFASAVSKQSTQAETSVARPQKIDPLDNLPPEELWGTSLSPQYESTPGSSLKQDVSGIIDAFDRAILETEALKLKETGRFTNEMIKALASLRRSMVKAKDRIHQAADQTQEDSSFGTSVLYISRSRLKKVNIADKALCSTLDQLPEIRLKIDEQIIAPLLRFKAEYEKPTVRDFSDLMKITHTCQTRSLYILDQLPDDNDHVPRKIIKSRAMSRKGFTGSLSPSKPTGHAPELSPEEREPFEFLYKDASRDMPSSLSPEYQVGHGLPIEEVVVGLEATRVAQRVDTKSVYHNDETLNARSGNRKVRPLPSTGELFDFTLEHSGGISKTSSPSPFPYLEGCGLPYGDGTDLLASSAPKFQESKISESQSPVLFGDIEPSWPDHAEAKIDNKEETYSDDDLFSVPVYSRGKMSSSERASMRVASFSKPNQEGNNNKDQNLGRQLPKLKTFQAESRAYHSKMVDFDEHKYVCNVKGCRKIFTTRYSLNGHMKTHNFQGSGVIRKLVSKAEADEMAKVELAVKPGVCLAERALASVGASALIANHRENSGNGLERNEKRVLPGVLLGAIGAELVTRPRNVMRGRSRSRSRSSSRSSNGVGKAHHKIKTGLALAAAGLSAAAAAKYIRNRNEIEEESVRGRSRTRSITRRREYYSDEGELIARHSTATIAGAGSISAATVMSINHFRNKSRSRSISRLRSSVTVASTGLAGAAVAGLYETRLKSREGTAYDSASGRNRSMSRDFRYSSGDEEPPRTRRSATFPLIPVHHIERAHDRDDSKHLESHGDIPKEERAAVKAEDSGPSPSLTQLYESSMMGLGAFSGITDLTTVQDVERESIFWSAAGERFLLLQARLSKNLIQALEKWTLDDQPLASKFNWKDQLLHVQGNLKSHLPTEETSENPIYATYFIFHTLEESIGLGTAPQVWTLVCVLLLLAIFADMNDCGDILPNQVVNVVAIMARYAVTENLYHQWQGITLKKDYEESLIDLSYRIFLYLAHAVCMLDGVEQRDDDLLQQLDNNIGEADATCQKFSVVVDYIEDNTDDRGEIDDENPDSDDDEALEKFVRHTRQGLAGLRSAVEFGGGS